MLQTDLTTYRRGSEPDLLAGLAERSTLALAEALTRTLPAAHAVARRLMGTREVEPLLHTVYAELWDNPPADGSLERWARARVCELGLDELRRRVQGPAAPSVRTIAGDLPEGSGYVDPCERQVAALEDADREALLQAHDLGLASWTQDAPDATAALTRALIALAEPTATERAAAAGAQHDPELADHVLGLQDPRDAVALEAAIAADPGRSAIAQLLRRGRRRVEGLPPTPDLTTRLLAAVLGSAPRAPGPSRPAPPPAVVATASALDAPATSRDVDDNGPSTGEIRLHERNDSDNAVMSSVLGGGPAAGQVATRKARPESAGDDVLLPDDLDSGDEDAADDDSRVVATYTAGEDDEYPRRTPPSRSRLAQTVGTVILWAAGIGIGLVLGPILYRFFFG